MVTTADLDSFRRNGFLLLKQFFTPEEVKKVNDDVHKVFTIQLIEKGVLSEPTSDKNEFENAMYQLFEQDLECFMNIGKQVQHLVSLHRLSLDSKIIKTLETLGLDFPNISTRPVLYFNHPNLAKEKVYHTVFAHQDWRSMQGSLDAVVLWFPLVDIDKSLGALEVIPGSHLWGLRTDEVESGFGKVKLSEEEKAMMTPVEVEVGDALFFSSLLVHQSGNNSTENIRWSAHFRYNNLADQSFVKRKFAHPYIYKPSDELITPSFPTIEEIKKIYFL